MSPLVARLPVASVWPGFSTHLYHIIPHLQRAAAALNALSLYLRARADGAAGVEPIARGREDDLQIQNYTGGEVGWDARI